MELIWIIVGIVAFLTVAVLAISYICFRLAFYTSRKRPVTEDVLALPNGEIYASHLEFMKNCTQQLREMPCQELWVTSFDGLKLYGRYFEYAPGAPIELMFHGYRGSADRDLAGGVQRGFKLGHSVLLVDQRCSGKSEGNIITFGVKEHRDCLSWLEEICTRYPNNKLILTGISMGASTVLMAAGTPLPENVVGVIADCGYTGAKEIIKSVIKTIGLPPALCYPFVKLGAKLYGQFDLEEGSALEAIRNCKVPVIFFHGEDDTFVPCYMSQSNYDACVSKKMLITVPGAEHGLSYPVQPERYIASIKEFFGYNEK